MRLRKPQGADRAGRSTGHGEASMTIAASTTANARNSTDPDRQSFTHNQRPLRRESVSSIDMLAELPEHRRAPFVAAFNEMVTELSTRPRQSISRPLRKRRRRRSNTETTQPRHCLSRRH